MKIITKFEIKQDVFFLHESSVRSGAIIEISVTVSVAKFSGQVNQSTYYTVQGIHGRCFQDTEIFSQKEDLLKTL